MPTTSRIDHGWAANEGGSQDADGRTIRDAEGKPVPGPLQSSQTFIAHGSAQIAADVRANRIDERVGNAAIAHAGFGLRCKINYYGSQYEAGSTAHVLVIGENGKHVRLRIQLTEEMVK